MIARDSENKIKDSISSTVRQLHRQDGAHGIGIFSKVFFNHTESWSERERETERGRHGTTKGNFDTLRLRHCMSEIVFYFKLVVETVRWVWDDTILWMTAAVALVLVANLFRP